MRGNSAYDHIRTLKELEFITSEPKGRSRLLKLTPKFFDYFDIVEKEMKEKFHPVGEKQEQILTEKNVSLVEVSPEDGVEEEPAVEEELVVAEAAVEEEAVVAAAEPEKVEVELSEEPEEGIVQVDADDFGTAL